MLPRIIIHERYFDSCCICLPWVETVDSSSKVTYFSAAAGWENLQMVVIVRESLPKCPGNSGLWIIVMFLFVYVYRGKKPTQLGNLQLVYIDVFIKEFSASWVVLRAVVFFFLRWMVVKRSGWCLHSWNCQWLNSEEVVLGPAQPAGGFCLFCKGRLYFEWQCNSGFAQKGKHDNIYLENSQAL